MKLTFYTIVIVSFWYFLYFIDFASPTIPHPFGVIRIFISTEIFTIFSRLMTTLLTVAITLGLSIAIGYTIGIITTFSTVCNSIFYPIFNGIKSVPITVFLPVFLVIFHIDNFIIPMICVPLIATLSVNITNASKTVNETRKNIFNSLSNNKISYFLNILFWETLEAFFATLRIILTYALTLEIALDYFLRYNKGIGDYISHHYESYSDEKYIYMYGGIIAASSVGIILVYVLDLLTARLLKWKVQIH